AEDGIRDWSVTGVQTCALPILLVADETQCGVGRPGTYFAYQRAHPVVMPDVMVTAKPLGVGIPLGVIMSNERAAAAIKPGMHGKIGRASCRERGERWGGTG